MDALTVTSALLRLLLASRASLAAENLALRRQLVVLRRSVKRPKVRRRDRVFWVWLSRLWTRWRSCLLIVQPEGDPLASAGVQGVLARSRQTVLAVDQQANVTKMSMVLRSTCTAFSACRFVLLCAGQGVARNLKWRKHFRIWGESIS